MAPASTAPATRIRATTVVRLPPATPPPATTKIGTSFFDTFFLSFPSIKAVLLYPSSSLPFATVAADLKSSLARVLPHFHVLGGTVAADGDGAVVIDCSDVGVQFIEAETDLDMDGLITAELKDKDAFLQLAPVIDAQRLPAPAMAVQVTEFAGGGLALVVEVHHGVVDGRGLWLFIDAWKQAFKDSSSPPPAKAPVHDRAAIVNAPSFHAGEIPKLPLASDGGGRSLERRAFVLTADTVNYLKKQAASAGGKPPSTFSVLMAHAWVSIAHVKVDNGGDFGAIFFADCRARLNPPVDDAFTGNCVAPAYVKLLAADLAAPDGGLARALELIKDAVDAANADPVKFVGSFAPELVAAMAAGPMLLTGSPRFSGLGTDFGWGCPGRCEFASFDYDGEVMLSAGKDAGSVEAAVTLAGDKMEAFAEAFLVKKRAN